MSAIFHFANDSIVVLTYPKFKSAQHVKGETLWQLKGCHVGGHDFAPHFICTVFCCVPLSRPQESFFLKVERFISSVLSVFP